MVGKVGISRSSILHNCFFFRPGYHFVCAFKLCTLVRTIMRNAPTQCALCLAAMCRHWGETCRKLNGIYWLMSILSEIIGPFHLARWWRYELWIQPIVRWIPIVTQWLTVYWRNLQSIATLCKTGPRAVWLLKIFWNTVRKVTIPIIIFLIFIGK